MEYTYGDMEGVVFTLQSLQALQRRAPDRVLPSHGEPIDAPGRDIDRLRERLMDVRAARAAACETAGDQRRAPETVFLPEPRLVPLSRHLLWGGVWTCSNFYVVLSDTGKALFVDYGHAFWPHMHVGADHDQFETMRFVEHHLDELEERYGVTAIDLVAPTHIHDDHTCGIPYLQRHHGTECWALDKVAQVLEDPAAWASTPCVFPKPIRIDRVLADGETVPLGGVRVRRSTSPRARPSSTPSSAPRSTAGRSRSPATTGSSTRWRPAARSRSARSRRPCSATASSSRCTAAARR